jgi:peptidoglycan hydrolase CwlO-like protein
MTIHKKRPTQDPSSDVYEAMVIVNELSAMAAELATDHATNKTLLDELKTDYTALLADVATIRTAVNAIITAAGTDLPAVAAVTPAAAATATAIAASSAAALTATVTGDQVGNADGTAYA